MKQQLLQSTNQPGDGALPYILWVVMAGSACVPCIRFAEQGVFLKSTPRMFDTAVIQAWPCFSFRFRQTSFMNPLLYFISKKFISMMALFLCLGLLSRYFFFQVLFLHQILFDICVVRQHKSGQVPQIVQCFFIIMSKEH